MSLVIGILVDDSTVVLENIERHHEELHEPPEEAAVRGREEIGAAAIVITLVDVVVFFPIAFISGQVGRNLNEFAIVVVISTLTSLFVSFTITPTLAGPLGAQIEMEALARRQLVHRRLRQDARRLRSPDPALGDAQRRPRRGTLRGFVRRLHRIGSPGRRRRRIHPGDRPRHDLRAGRPTRSERR